MTTSANHDERMAKMIFATVYPLYLTKVEKKVEPKMNCIRLSVG